MRDAQLLFISLIVIVVNSLCARYPVSQEVLRKVRLRSSSIEKPVCGSGALPTSTSSALVSVARALDWALKRLVCLSLLLKTL